MKTMLILAIGLAGCAARADDAIDPDRCEAPRVYRVDRVELPRNNAAARDLSLDLDGDGHVDNALGQISASLTTMFSDVPLDLEHQANTHLVTDTDWRISIADCGATERLVAIGGGDATLELAGTAVDERLQAGGTGLAMVPVVALFDGSGAQLSVFAPSEHTEVRLTATDGELDGVVGFAIAGEVASPLVVHGMTRFLDEHLEFGRGELDANSDGTITELEVATSGFAQALLGTDLVVDDVAAISLGVRIHATRM